jgi:hypothetical protein
VQWGPGGGAASKDIIVKARDGYGKFRKRITTGMLLVCGGAFACSRPGTYGYGVLSFFEGDNSLS